MKRVSILLRQETGFTNSEERFIAIQSGATSQSQLVSVNGYLVYSDTIGGGVVNNLNVRDFLDDPINEVLATSFFNFLNSNTTSAEFNAIFNSSDRLSNTFNSFYNQTNVLGVRAQNNKITQELSGSSAHTYTSVDFLPNGKRSSKQIAARNFTSSGDSHYIPIEIQLNVGMVETSDFSKFHQNSFGDSQIKQETLLRRFSQRKNVQLPNPANSPAIEYQSFHGPLIGRSGVTAFKFKTDKHIVNQVDIAGKIQVDLVYQFPISTTGQTIFISTLAAETTATLGIDFDMDDPSLTGKSYKKFYLNPGDTGVTTTIRLFDAFKSNKSKEIVLYLTPIINGVPTTGAGNVMVADNRKFEVINRQLPLQVNKLVDINEVVISPFVRKQKLLQGFVDFNFNDNESEFWRNDNVKVVKKR